MLRRPSRPVFSLLAALLALLSSGCSGQMADVQGSVSYNGAPVEKGMITFTPTGKAGSVVGSKIESGRFHAKDVFAGQNIVVVAATRDIAFAQNSEEMATNAPPSSGTNWKSPADLIPHNAEGNNVAYDLVAGGNTMDLQLSSPKTP